MKKEGKSSVRVWCQEWSCCLNKEVRNDAVQVTLGTEESVEFLYYNTLSIWGWVPKPTPPVKSSKRKEVMKFWIGTFNRSFSHLECATHMWRFGVIKIGAKMDGQPSVHHIRRLPLMLTSRPNTSRTCMMLQLPYITIEQISIAWLQKYKSGQLTSYVIALALFSYQVTGPY